MNKPYFKIVTGITLYRILAAPVLIYLAFSNHFGLFKWLLPVSYFTDLVDGPLARKLNVMSELGSRLDSIGDDLTVLASLTGLLIFKKDFLNEHIGVFLILFILFLSQIVAALIRFRKTTSFHTILAKAAAVLQGTFLILFFLLPEPLNWLFYLAAVVTFFELLEEIILVIILPKWEINVKGLFWVLKKN